VDTRCAYYNQTYEWRKAIDFCMKKDGKTCWIATRNKRCVAVSSSDAAPALIALGAKVRLVSVAGEREMPLADLYRDDGKDYLARKPDEILTEVSLPAGQGWTSTYWKLRRRGSFDFPLLGVAAASRTAPDGAIEEARVVLGAMSSRPLLTKVGKFLLGKRLTDEVIAETICQLFPRLREGGTNPGKQLSAGEQQTLAMGRDLYWRKEVAGAVLGYALREIRGDDMRETRVRIARQAL
jgi:4-hydroxybenzoyl-CoA reductase subunit beta